MLSTAHGEDIQTMSDIQETQTWDAQGHLAEDPYYSSLDSQIFHTVIDKYGSEANVQSRWIEHEN